VPITSHLFDAAGEDRAVDLKDHPLAQISDDEILWVDVQAPDDADLERLGAASDWQSETLTNLAHQPERARLRLYPGYVHLTVVSVICEDELRLEAIDLLAGEGTSWSPSIPPMCQRWPAWARSTVVTRAWERCPPPSSWPSSSTGS
jgi:hypothetical protein